MCGSGLKGEWYKIFYDRWLLGSIVGILVFVPALVLVLDPLPGETGEWIHRSKLLQGFYLGQVGSCIFSALYFGQEYQRSTLRTGLLCLPKRQCLFLSKCCCALLCTVFLLLVSYACSDFALHTFCGGEYKGDTLTALLPALLSTLELTLIAAAIVILTRSPIGAIAVLTALILGVGNLLLQYGRWMRYLPVLATMNSFLNREAPAYLPVWAGTAVQGLWCVVLLLIAAVVFQKRPVQ